MPGIIKTGRRFVWPTPCRFRSHICGLGRSAAGAGRDFQLMLRGRATCAPSKYSVRSTQDQIQVYGVIASYMRCKLILASWLSSMKRPALWLALTLLHGRALPSGYFFNLFKNKRRLRNQISTPRTSLKRRRTGEQYIQSKNIEQRKPPDAPVPHCRPCRAACYCSANKPRPNVPGDFKCLMV